MVRERGTKATCQNREPEHERPTSLHNLGCVGLVLVLRDLSDSFPLATGNRLWIKRVTNDSAAARCGQIFAGMEVLQVNGMKILDCLTSCASSSSLMSLLLDKVVCEFAGEVILDLLACLFAAPRILSDGFSRA